MVIGDKLPWRMIFRLHAPYLGATAEVAIIAFLLEQFLQVKFPVTPVPFQIAGVALAIFLGFRNNSAYDRWWEGRKLWGGIVNQSRTLARQVLTLFVAPDGDRAELAAFHKRVLYRHMAWLQAIKQQLRGLEIFTAIAPYLSEAERAAAPAQKNVALALNTICRNIEINVRQQLGETDLPEPIATEAFGNATVLL